MAKKKSSKEIKLDKQSIDKEMKKSGLTWTSVAGAVIVIIGILAVLFGLQGAAGGVRGSCPDILRT
jgi:hypothetical protein